MNVLIQLNSFINRRSYEKLSETAKSLLDNEIGYRNNCCYNSEIYKFQDMFKYEVYELENQDIIDTVKLLYPDFAKLFSNKYECIPEYVSKKFDCNVDEVKGLWLTSNYGVLKYYMTGEDDLITSINFGNTTYMIVSDLNDEGILIAYKGDVLYV